MTKTDEYLSVRNFEKYQHYSHRRPPWIKLYWSLLSDPEYMGLSDQCKHHIVAIMLLASQYDNRIPYDKNWISRVIHANTRINWDQIFQSGFVIASSTLAGCKQDGGTEVQNNRITEVQSKSVRSDSETESSEPPVITFPLTDKTEYFLTATQLSELSNLYPGVDPEKELLKAKGWLIANPTRRKTRRGISRFLHGWLSRSQDKGNGSNGSSKYQSGQEDILDIRLAEALEQEAKNGKF